MTENYSFSITPPPELVQKWAEQFKAGKSLYAMFEDIYSAGADQELEACCLWLNGGSKIDYDTAALLRAARRPKPPSLKEQALTALTRYTTGETILTTELSPAANAVLDAYMDNCGWLDGPLQRDYQCVAAVLRTVVEIVASPEQVDPDSQWDLGFVAACTAIYGDILAIADELEGTND